MARFYRVQSPQLEETGPAQNASTASRFALKSTAYGLAGQAAVWPSSDLATSNFPAPRISARATDSSFNVWLVDNRHPVAISALRCLVFIGNTLPIACKILQYHRL
jgi:hypothetical protein